MNKKKLKGWLLSGLRWMIAIVGVYLVVKNMSFRDRALVILDPAKNNTPQWMSLHNKVSDDAEVYSVVGVGPVKREQVVNEPDVKTIDWQGQTVDLLGLDLPEGGNAPFDQTMQPTQLLVRDPHTGHGTWIKPQETPYQTKIPHHRDQVGILSMIHGAKPWLLGLAILVFPLTFIITSYRWHDLLEILDIHVTLGKAFAITMVGCFYNTFLPGSTGGDVLKAVYASKQTPHRTRAVMSVLVDRVIGLLALVVLGGVMASLQWQVPACRKVAMGSALILGCVAIGLTTFFNPTLHRLSGLDFFLKRLPMQKQVRGAVEAMHMYGQRPWGMLWALVISLPVHAAVVSSAMFAGKAFNLPLSAWYYWVCVPVIVLSGAVPIAPQGAGVMEYFAYLLTRRQGCTVSQAVALTMSIRLVQILWNLTGVILVLRGGYHAPTEEEQKALDSDAPEKLADSLQPTSA